MITPRFQFGGGPCCLAAGLEEFWTSAEARRRSSPQSRVPLSLYDFRRRLGGTARSVFASAEDRGRAASAERSPSWPMARWAVRPKALPSAEDQPGVGSEYSVAAEMPAAELPGGSGGGAAIGIAACGDWIRRRGGRVRGRRRVRRGRRRSGSRRSRRYKSGRCRLRVLHLLQLRSAIYQVLLDVADGQLHVEIVDVGFGDLLQPEKDGFQPAQFLYGFDLLVQAL